MTNISSFVSVIESQFMGISEAGIGNETAPGFTLQSGYHWQAWRFGIRCEHGSRLHRQDGARRAGVGRQRGADLVLQAHRRRGPAHGGRV